MIDQCGHGDFDAINRIINDGADAYWGIIPDDRWHEPYMCQCDLRREIDSGVRFWGCRDDVGLVGVHPGATGGDL